jgi:TonB family protein
MSASSRGDRPQARQTPSANERLRERWRAWLRYGTAASLVGHAAILLLSPSWQWSERAPRVVREPLRLEWLPPPETTADPDGTAAAAAPEPAVEDPDPEAGEEGSEMGLADLLDVLRDRVPTNFTPVIAQNEERPPEADYNATAVDYSSIVGSGPLDLDRLSTVSPELALSTGTPDWPLIRNPNRVIRFIRSGYDRVHRLEPADGLVTVAMWIDGNGSVEWAEIHESSGYADLDEIALEVLSEVAEFRPVRRQGVTETLALLVSIRFPF